MTSLARDTPEERPDAIEAPYSSSPTSRRTFLTRTLAAGGSLLALGGCEPGNKPAKSPEESTVAVENTAAFMIPEGKLPANFVLHVENPLGLETRRTAFGASVIVPYELLYVRNNLPTPDPSIVADPDGWVLTVEGVQNPRTITVGALKELGLETVATVLQCAGNGRAFFEHDASGSKWGVGAAGCVLWSGVPVHLVAEALGGVTSGMRFVTGTGGETLPEGIDHRTIIVERSIPLEKGLKDALLAWQINGAPIPLANGGPLRLIVPGYYGCNQIKYIKRLAFTSQESDAKIMESSYRFRPIGEKGAPDQPTMWEMSVKSWINHPGNKSPIPAGRCIIDGVAFGGATAVKTVEVSIDGGQSWQVAPFVGPDLGTYAWRQFALPVTLKSGAHTLASRATDASGNIQPADRLENERGYGNTSWRDHAITITVV